MHNDEGQSTKARLNNHTKMTKPAYVSNPKDIDVIRDRRKKSQGRNELCLCGSGKKYKNCHGRVVLPLYAPRKTSEELDREFTEAVIRKINEDAIQEDEIGEASSSLPSVEGTAT